MVRKCHYKTVNTLLSGVQIAMSRRHGKYCKVVYVKCRQAFGITQIKTH